MFFPSPAIFKEKDRVYETREIRNHGIAVIKMLDEMIEVFENVFLLRTKLKEVVRKHIGLHTSGFDGENFKVCSFHFIST